jgi:hypothetical protein
MFYVCSWTLSDGEFSISRVCGWVHAAPMSQYDLQNVKLWYAVASLFLKMLVASNCFYKNYLTIKYMLFFHYLL